MNDPSAQQDLISHVVQAVAAMEQEGWQFPLSNPSGRESRLYDVLNAAKALADHARGISDGH